MRIAPVALAFHKAPLSTALHHAAVVSAATHPYPACTEACQLYTALIYHVLQGEPKAMLATRVSRFISGIEDENIKADYRDDDNNNNSSSSEKSSSKQGADGDKQAFRIHDKQLLARMQCYRTDCSDVINISASAGANELKNEDDEDEDKDKYTNKALQKWQDRPIDAIKSSGFVVSTLEAALWVFFTTDTFESGVVKAVSLGMYFSPSLPPSLSLSLSLLSPRGLPLFPFPPHHTRTPFTSDNYFFFFFLFFFLSFWPYADASHRLRRLRHRHRRRRIRRPRRRLLRLRRRAAALDQGAQWQRTRRACHGGFCDCDAGPCDLKMMLFNKLKKKEK